MRRCVEDVKAVNRILAALEARCAEHFSSKSDEHEAALERLWQLLLPGETRDGGRYSRDWNRIGFQQSDPASDFRGGGIFCLDQLLYIASTRMALARRMIVEPAAEQSRYPWACVGFNVTKEVIRLFKARTLDERLFGKTVDEGLEVMHSVYADIFEILHARWVEANPENLLAFPEVFKSTMAGVNKELEATGTLVPPGAQA